jgi:hypothetical protein
MTATTAPIAWMVYTLDGKSAFVTDNPKDFTQDHRALPLYTAPPQRKPLTDEEINALDPARQSPKHVSSAESITEAMMNVADRLGSEYDKVDSRAWDHLLVYAPNAPSAQKPFCYHDGRNIVGKEFAQDCDVFPLYTDPPQRKPLTDEQVNECGMCGYVGKDKDKTGQCPKCRWDELRPLTGKAHQKPLTDDQIYEMYNEPRSDAEMLEFARAIEAAHGIKGEA